MRNLTIIGVLVATGALGVAGQTAARPARKVHALAQSQSVPAMPRFRFENFTTANGLPDGADARITRRAPKATARLFRRHTICLMCSALDGSAGMATPSIDVRCRDFQCDYATFAPVNDNLAASDDRRTSDPHG